MPIRIQHLRQGKVKTEGCFRPRVHRDAETGSTGVAAIERHDKEIFPARLIRWVCIISTHEYPILNSDGVEFTGTYANKGISRRGPVLGSNVKSIAFSPGLP